MPSNSVAERLSHTFIDRNKVFETIATIFWANWDFQKDRPVVDFNNNDRLSITLNLLQQEISELNGGADDGYFMESVEEKGKTKKREDYRQQEVADIVMFIMAVYNKLGITAKDINDKQVFGRAYWVALAHDIEIIESKVELKEVPIFDDNQEEKYQKLRSLLNDQAEKLLEIIRQNSQDAELIKPILDEMLSLCFVIFYLMELHPIRATMEKVARNILKYPAVIMAYTQEELDAVGGDIEHLYKEKGKTAKDQWDATDKNGRLLGLSHTTEDFYGFWERERKKRRLGVENIQDNSERDLVPA